MAAAFTTYTGGVVDLNGTIVRSPDGYTENPNATLIRRTQGGNIDPIYSAVGTVAPSITFNTPEVGTVLNLIGKHGLEITTVVAYQTQKGQVARGGAGVHLSTTVNDGIIVPRQLSWNGEAEVWSLTVEIFGISGDGTTAPFVYANNASLPALALIPKTFTGGKLTINAAELNCWQSATFDFGLTVTPRFHKGLVYPGFVGVQSALPTLTVTNLDPDTRNTYGITGTRLTAAVLYLRANETVDGSAPTRKADADAGNPHTSLTMVDGIIHPGATSVSEPDNTQELIVVFDENASAAAVVINSSVQIA